MYKKMLCLCAILAGLSYIDGALAVPTVRKLGGVTASPTVATDTAQHNSGATRQAQTQITSVKTTPAITNRPTTSSAKPVSVTDRLSMLPINNVKSVKTVKQQSVISDKSSVSDEEFNAVTEKIDTVTDKVDSMTDKVDSMTDKVDSVSGRVDSITDKIESIEGNIITDVVQNSGTYVTDVSVDNNTLKVDKTSVLYVPIKTTEGATLDRTAEIYVVQ